MKKATHASILLLAVLACPLAAQGARSFGDSFFSVEARPEASLPVLAADSVLGPGFGGAFAARWSIGDARLFSLGLATGYEYLSPDMPGTVSTAWGALEAGLALGLSPRLEAHTRLRGGWFESFLNEAPSTNGGNILAYAGLGLDFLATPALGIGLDVGWRGLFGFSDSLALSLGVSLHFPKAASVEERLGLVAKPLKSMTAPSIRLADIYPVLYTYYDDHPVGKAMVVNGDKAPIEDLTASVYIQGFMPAPKPCPIPSRLEAGAGAEFDLFALLDDRVLAVTESTKAAATIVVEGTNGGRNFRNEWNTTVRILDRNASSWDDDRKVAAFVTVKDPEALRFSKGVTAAVKGLAPVVLDRNMMAGIAVHEALALHGMTYTIDPSSSYKSRSESKATVDYLQFPRQTLEYRAGDCDDLSILWASLLEGLGVPTAFVTVPGHIYIALALQAAPEVARKQYSNSDALILRDGIAWMPVEVTSIDGGFLRAWDEGAREWRDAAQAGNARLIPLAEAWKTYEPVGFSSGEARIPIPDSVPLKKAFSAEVERFVAREVQPREASYRADIASGKNVNDARNKLGVLYARYGEFDKAEEQFAAVLKAGDALAPLVNIANLSLARGEAEKALSWAARAARIDQRSAQPVLITALAQLELARYADLKSSWDRLKAMDPALAARYAYLGATDPGENRAGDANARKEVAPWTD